MSSVRIRSKFRQLKDVVFGTPADGDVVQYDQPSGKLVLGPAAGGGVSDHGALTGLPDDDHLQYHTDARGDARYWPLATDLATQVELNAHAAAADPHPGYTTAAELAAFAQPLDSDLTAIATLATTAFGRGLLTLANQAALLAEAGAAAAAHAHAGEDIASGTVADARIAATIARDSEVTAAVAGEATARDTAISVAIANLIDSSPGVLDTLNELAAALGDDPNFAATITTALAGKQPLDSDLTAIAALATTAYGRSLFEAANAAALRSLAGLVIDTDVPGQAAFDDHSGRHENGGGDEISVAGLSGLLADAQTPLGHQAAHNEGGSDELKLDDLGIPDDNTDLNASNTRHGLMPKLDGSSAKAFMGDGTWVDVATQAELQAHLDDGSAAHAASAVSYAGGTGIAATDVEAALDELANEKLNLPVYADYTPVLTAATTNPTMGVASSISGRYCQIGKFVQVFVFAVFGTSGVVAGSGEYFVSLPVAIGASQSAFGRLGIAFLYDSSAPLGRIGVVQFNNQTTKVSIWVDSATSVVTHASPWTWAANDLFTLTFCYESS